MSLDSLSNNEGDGQFVSDELIDELGEQLKATLKKQFNNRDKTFRLRMSNIGRPLCVLQNEQAGVTPARRDYNFIIKMLHGDMIEAIMVAILKSTPGINVTGEKKQVSLKVNDTTVLGEDDIEIDNKVWDVKSSSNWAFNNKWKHGFNAIYDGDTFGYVAQLYGYAKAQGKEPGGWIVVNKETGEVLVVNATPTKDQLKQIQENIEYTERALATGLPFKRQFTDEAETFYKKETGNRVMPIPCTFCDFKAKCWPDAVLKRQALSKAQNPKSVWYTHYVETNDEAN